MTNGIIHKYVVVSDGQREHVVAFDGGIQHRTVVPKGMKAVSAGFFIPTKSGVAVPEIGSESLGLEPRQVDKAMIEAFLKEAI